MPDLATLSEGLTGGWRALWDKAGSRIYYANMITKVGAAFVFECRRMLRCACCARPLAVPRQPCRLTVWWQCGKPRAARAPDAGRMWRAAPRSQLPCGKTYNPMLKCDEQMAPQPGEALRVQRLGSAGATCCWLQQCVCHACRC